MPATQIHGMTTSLPPAAPAAGPRIAVRGDGGPLPVASIIIPHFNMPDALDRCLASVCSQQIDGRFEVIVVDNGSHRLPHDVIARHRGVQLLVETTPGPGPARNTGVAASVAPWLAFIDADCRAERGWLAAALAAMAPAGEHAVVGGDVRLDYADTARLTAVEAYEGVFAFRQKLYITRRNFSGTGNLAMHRRVHARVGPFAGIGLAEDVDWGGRATAAGLRILYVEAMRAYHPARPDVKSLVVKWDRHIAHDWAAHRAAAAPAWRWLARAAAMLPSIIIDGVRLLLSDRVPGMANRLRGLPVLARIRMFRMARMIAVWRAGSSDARAVWQGRN